MTKEELKEHIEQAVIGLREQAVEVLKDGEYPKALRYLAEAKQLDEFIKWESFLSGV